jgi:membrane fusion protein (multidrug efflux system)
LTLLALVALGGCKKSASPPAPPQVGVLTLRASSASLTTDLPGRVVAHREADVRPQVSGVILKRFFREGSDVTQGEPLFQIDPAPYAAAESSAEAAVEKSSANVRSSAALVERYRPLAAAAAVSRQDLDDAVAAEASARADLAAAEAALAAARLNVGYASVLAPISGRIGRALVTEGSLVTANQADLLATILQLDPIYVDVALPSSTLLRLRREQKAGTLVSAGRNQAVVHLTLEDGTAYKHAGTLAVSEVSVDPGTGSVTLRAVFPNPEDLLLPGMFVHELVQEGVDERAILVPQQAVTHDQRGQPTAYVVAAGDKAELRTLKTDRAVGDRWLVTDGLRAGDRVIVDGLQKVAPGAPVTPVEVRDDSAPAASAAPGDDPPR